jgi:hypothetical protein
VQIGSDGCQCRCRNICEVTTTIWRLVFFTWFRPFLIKLRPNSVRVMGSACYQSVKVERVPTCRGEKMTTDIMSGLKIVAARANAYERGTCTAIRELSNREIPLYCHISGYLY